MLHKHYHKQDHPVMGEMLPDGFRFRWMSGPNAGKWNESGSKSQQVFYRPVSSLYFKLLGWKIPR